MHGPKTTTRAVVAQHVDIHIYGRRPIIEGYHRRGLQKQAPPSPPQNTVLMLVQDGAVMEKGICTDRQRRLTEPEIRPQTASILVPTGVGGICYLITQPIIGRRPYA